MLANLFGDFVKGKDYTYLPEDVQRGVLLHRQIDDYVDHHPKVTELRLMLYKDLPKIAGIAIDLYFDHLLAKQWKFYHNKNLFDYIDSFLSYALNPNHLTYKEKGFAYPQSFIHLLQIIKEKNIRSEEHTSEPSHVRISYAVFCLKKKKKKNNILKLEYHQLVAKDFDSIVIIYDSKFNPHFEYSLYNLRN